MRFRFWHFFFILKELICEKKIKLPPIIFNVLFKSHFQSKCVYQISKISFEWFIIFISMIAIKKFFSIHISNINLNTYYYHGFRFDGFRSFNFFLFNTTFFF